MSIPRPMQGRSWWGGLVLAGALALTLTACSSSSTAGSSTSSTRPIGCPSSHALTELLPSGDRAVPVSNIACSGEWAVGDYSQAGRNQVVGVFHYGTADGHWGLDDRNQACAQSINLPPSLYQRACSNN